MCPRLSAERLESIGRIVAAQSPNLDFQDVQQEIRIRFWRFPPRKEWMAWRLAQNVRNDLWRRERQHRHADLEIASNVEAPHGEEDTEEAMFIVDELQRMEPEKVRFLLTYGESHNHTPREKVKASRCRQALRVLCGISRLSC